MTDVLELIAYKDGEYMPVSRIGPSILDFGFIHSDATYDVMPIYNGKAFCLERHISRFKKSTERYGLQLPTLNYTEILQNIINMNASSNLTNAFVWFAAWRGYPASGNPRDIDSTPVHFSMYVKPSYPLVNKSTINVYLDETAYRVNDRYYGQEYKNMNWIDFTLAQRNIPDGYDTCVLVDDDGFLTEGPGFNVGFVRDEKIMTPAHNCLKGITMSVVEDISSEQNIDFMRQNIKSSDWHSMCEIFLASSSGGITAVKSGPITDMLIAEYELKKGQSEYATTL